MAVAIVSTVGSATANSFVTLAEAQTYMDTRLNGALWEAATTDNQNRALVEAAREITVLKWGGRRADTTQVLDWPRDWVRNPDDPNFSHYAATVIPQRVQDAQCELAFQYIKAGTTDVAAEDANQYITAKAIDVIRTEYSDPWSRTTGLRRYPRVWALVSPLLVGTRQTSVVRG